MSPFLQICRSFIVVSSIHYRNFLLSKAMEPLLAGLLAWSVLVDGILCDSSSIEDQGLTGGGQKPRLAPG